MGTDSASVIDIVSLILLAASSTFLGFATYLILKFSAQPRLRVTVHLKEDGEDEATRKFYKDKLPFPKEAFSKEKSTVQFRLENVGHWYGAKPVATDITLWVNFKPACEPQIIRFGSAPNKKEEKKVERGKGDSKYLTATGITLFQEEPGEEVEVEVKIPEEILEEKECHFWVTAHAKEGGCGVHKFRFEVI